MSGPLLTASSLLSVHHHATFQPPSYYAVEMCRDAGGRLQEQRKCRLGRVLLWGGQDERDVETISRPLYKCLKLDCPRSLITTLAPFARSVIRIPFPSDDSSWSITLTFSHRTRTSTTLSSSQLSLHHNIPYRCLPKIVRCFAVFIRIYY